MRLWSKERAKSKFSRISTGLIHFEFLVVDLLIFILSNPKLLLQNRPFFYLVRKKNRLESNLDHSIFFSVLFRARTAFIRSFLCPCRMIVRLVRNLVSLMTKKKIEI